MKLNYGLYLVASLYTKAWMKLLVLKNLELEVFSHLVQLSAS